MGLSLQRHGVRVCRSDGLLSLALGSPPTTLGVTCRGRDALGSRPDSGA